MKLMSFCQPRFILHRLGKQKRVIPTDIEFISICFAPAFRLYSVRLASAPTNLRYLRLCSVGYFIHAINGSSNGCFLRQQIQQVQPKQPWLAP